MGLVKGFIPYLVYGFAAGFLGWRAGAVTAMVCGIVLLTYELIRGTPAAAQILEVSSIVYFLGLATVAFLDSNSPIEGYQSPLSFWWLALTAGGSLVVGQPFTLPIAKLQTPREFWHMPEFTKVSVNIAAVWTAAFVFLAIALTVCFVVDASPAVDGTIHVLGLAVPIVVTVVYPKRAQARLQASLTSVNG
ncbi:hypothetical protein [Streptomyces sp. NPDC058683]|uniref:hypothetical protein n=1 Tax=Streptomyces sp. NPDC058683 TaxID=3346597 RepID=UPI003667C440